MRTHTFDLYYEYPGAADTRPLQSRLDDAQVDGELLSIQASFERHLPDCAVTRDADNKWRFYFETIISNEEVDSGVEQALSLSVLSGKRITGL